MVERPIKKSDRQSQVNTDSDSENVDSTPPVESNPKIIKKSNERSERKGKKASFTEESKQQVNPALARPPKPVKPKAKVTTEPEPESEPTSVESQDSDNGN